MKFLGQGFQKLDPNGTGTHRHTDRRGWQLKAIHRPKWQAVTLSSPVMRIQQYSKSLSVITQRDRAAAVCCAYVRKVHCAILRMVRTTGALLFFRYLLRLRRHKRKSVEVSVFRRGWVFLVNIWQGRGHRPPTNAGFRKLEWLPFRVVSKYLQCII